MAYFFINKCDFQNCARTFPTLYDLIIHIEDSHIDFSPNVIEETECQNVQCVPLSYVLRYSQEERKVFKESSPNLCNTINENTDLMTGDVKKQHTPLSIVESDISDESYDATAEEQNLICKRNFFNYRSRWYTPDMNISKRDRKQDLKPKLKRFSCPVTGCIKRYKNQNGMKYHILNYHDIKGNAIKPKKEFKCDCCGKEYKTARGLNSHALSHNVKNRPNLDYKVNPYYSSTNITASPFSKSMHKESYKRSYNSNECLNYTTLDQNSFADIDNRNNNELSSAYCSPLISPRQEAIYSVYSEYDLNHFNILKKD